MPSEGTSPTYTRIAQIDIQTGGLKEYYPARKVRTALLVLRLGGTHQHHHHTMVSAPFVDQPGHSHELCPKLKEAVRVQAEQIARIQMARYEEVRNQAQEPSSRTKKMINYIQDKAKIAKEDRQDHTRLPVYSTGGDGGGSGPDGDDDGDPTDQDRDSSSEWGVMDFLSEGEGVEEDRPRIQTRKTMMGYLGVSGAKRAQGSSRTPGTRRT